MSKKSKALASDSGKPAEPAHLRLTNVFCLERYRDDRPRLGRDVALELCQLEVWAVANRKRERTLARKRGELAPEITAVPEGENVLSFGAERDLRIRRAIFAEGCPTCGAKYSSNMRLGAHLRSCPGANEAFNRKMREAGQPHG